jgi:hypothetical protein
MHVSKRSNYLFPFSLMGMVRIYDVDLHLKMSPTKNPFLKKYGYYVMMNTKKLTTINKNPSESLENFKIREIQKLDERIELFLEKTTFRVHSRSQC